MNVSELTTVTPNYENVRSFTISTQLEMKECGAYGVMNNRGQRLIGFTTEYDMQ